MQFSLTFTQGFLKKSHSRRIFRSWWKLLIAIAVIIYAVIGDLHSGHFSAWSAGGVTAIGFCALIYGLAWIKQSRAIDDWLKKQGTAPVLYSLSEETVESTSEVGSTKLKWTTFNHLLISELDTLLIFSRSGALTMPTEQVPKEALEFMKQRFLAHGKKVEDRRKHS